MNHPSDDELCELVTNYTEWAEAVAKIKKRYTELNPAPATAAAPEVVPGA